MQADVDNRVLPRLPEHRPEDEVANLVTHGGAFLLTLPASAILMQQALQERSVSLVVACVVYCVTLVGLYACSALSHLFHDLAWRRFFRMLDQAFIFLLIVGSFTPISVIYLSRGWWPLLLGIMWVSALLGVMLVLHMRNLSSTARISYGVLGWMPVVALKPLFDSAPRSMFVWFVAGGLFYSVGTILLKFDHRVRYFHALWHTFVIAGSICHYLAILTSLIRL
jgi:hemolysin III